MARGSVTPQRALALAVAALLILALAPARFTRWVERFQQPVRFVFAPISETASLASRTLRPADRGDRSQDPDIRALTEERERFKLLYLQTRRENETLRERVRELQSGLELMPATGLRLLSARVIGSSNNVLLARAGESQGVIAGETVAVARGVHLVGRVISTSAQTCDILPVIDERTGLIDAAVFVAEPETSVACQLDPIGNGRLRGPVAGDGAGVEPGQVVRLSDPDWPPTAQMLILGRVESVAPSEEQPLRRIITVTPQIDLARVLRVTLRTPENEEASP